MLDLAVVGAGPCGLAVGVAAKRAHLGCSLFDRGPVVASLMRYPLYMTFFSSPEKLEIGVPFVTFGDKPTRREALAYYRRVAEHFELDVRPYHEVIRVHRAAAGAAGAAGAGFELVARHPGMPEPETVRCGHVVYATGYFEAANLLGVPGEGLPHVSHSFVEPHPFWQQRVVVVGGGNSAVEAALELTRSHVGVRREPDGDIELIPADFVLALTGYRADLTLLRSIGVAVDETSGIPRHDPATMETNVPGVYIAGVLASGFDANKIFIENGHEHGGRICDHIKSKPPRVAPGG